MMMVISALNGSGTLLLASAKTYAGEPLKTGAFHPPVAIHFLCLELEAVKVSALAHLLHPAFGIVRKKRNGVRSSFFTKYLNMSKVKK